MPSKIFVGNIASGSKDAELQALFEAFGEVTECDIVSNYAFVVSLLLISLIKHSFAITFLIL